MSKLNKNANYFIISDCHIGNHDRIDFCNYSKLRPFLSEVLMETKATLIINGDFFDFLKSFKSKIFRSNKDILDIINNLKKEERLIIIKGNHDVTNGVDNVVINNSVLVLHGHCFEAKARYFAGISHLISIIIGITERIFHMSIDLILSKFFHYDRMQKRSKKIIKKVNRFLNTHPEYSAVIIGHIHVPYASNRYFNTGCFTNNSSDFIEIEDNKIELKKY